MSSAKYTVLLKSLMENPETNKKIKAALSSYPLYEKQSKEEFKPSYIPTREELNNSILNFYKYREIGFETPGRFFDELEISMNEIMPKYNELFFSADQDFNIIFNVDYYRTIETDKGGTSSSITRGSDAVETITNGESENNTDTTDKQTTKNNMSDTAKTVHSATPQSELNISSDNIDSVSYADDAQWNKNTSDSEGETSGENTAKSKTTSSGKNTTTGNNEVNASGETQETEKTKETTKGNFGVVSSQDLILKYRETIINIKQMIIADPRIAELFMTVF